MRGKHGRRKKEGPASFFWRERNIAERVKRKLWKKREGAFELSDHFTLVVSSCFLKVAHPCYSFDLDVFPRMKIFA